MHFLLGAIDGETPLDPDEIAGLIPTWVATRGDLNRAEQEAIARALPEISRRSHATNDILTEAFVRRLHRDLFGDIWTWAGQYRATIKNIGVDPAAIVEELAKLLANASYWVANETFEPDGIAIRVHHRAVMIHPFVNGNGRHTRLLADLLAESLGSEAFSWGRALRMEPGPLRDRYIDALRRADAGDLSDLFAFARS